MKVSVIIPCYNGEEYIGQTLGSLLDQTRPADEIIVVDDGSEDRSAEIARSFGEPVMVLSKGGGGAANARNCGADYASGDALMFLDADDVLAPDVLENLLAQLELNSGGVVACPWFRLDKIDDKWVKRPPSCAPLGESQDYLSGWITGWYHLPCSILWSRNAYERTGGWDPRAYVNDDGDLMMRALADGIELQITDKGASFYRRMPEEKQSESLSGARFTRAGREAQIYVMKKIAQRLEEKGELDAYRVSFTKALDRFRRLCKVPYPDLSEKCSELINWYGEPRLARTTRKFISLGQNIIHDTYRFLSRAKNKLTTFNQSSDNYRNKHDEEIRFGIETYREASENSNEGKLSIPSRPGVSIVLPVFNKAAKIDRALSSVFTQEYDNFEIIIVDKTSDEGLEKIKTNFEDQRIRYVTDDNIQNIYTAYNRGLIDVKGEFVAFLNPGDEWLPEKLSKQLEHFKTVPETVGLVYSGVEKMDQSEEISTFQPRDRGNIYSMLLRQNVITSCSSVMIRRTVIPAAGFFDDSLSAMAEQDYWLRIARYFEFDFVEETLVRAHIWNGQNQKAISDNTLYEHSDARTAFVEKHLAAMKREKVDLDL